MPRIVPSHKALAPARGAILLTALLLGVLLMAGTRVMAAAGPPIRVTVEPESPALNPNGRLLKNGHPARFRITLSNETDLPQPGWLAPEVIGNLGTVHGLPRESLILAPRERRSLGVAWSYPANAVYPDLPNGALPSPGPSWGHEFRAAWLDARERVVDRAGTVFAIQHDGSPEGAPEGREVRALTPQEAFAVRYSGYLRNPAFEAAGAASELRLRVGGKAVSGLNRAVAPSGRLAFLVRGVAGAAPTEAVSVLSGPWHLAEAWLLDAGAAGAPRAERLFHRSDGYTATFRIPAGSREAALILEATISHPYIPPVPLAELAAAGEKQYGPLRTMLGDASGKPLTAPAGWAERKRRLRETVFQSLNVRPESATTPLDPRILSEEQVPEKAWPAGVTRPHLRRKVSIQITPRERMNVWVLVPPGAGPFPAVVALHQTVPEGKDEPVGLGGHYYALAFGPFLVSRGFVVIAPDSPLAGERYDPQSQSAYDTTQAAAKDPSWSLMGQRLHDHMRVVDYLQSLPFVDPARIGAIGHSLGGESTMMLTAMDDRVKCAAVSCGFTLLRTLEAAADTYALPSSAILPANFRKLLQVPVKDRKLPFDFDDCMALWAPRPVFLHDVRTELWPNAAQVAQAAVELRKLYRLLGAGDHFYAVYSNQTHSFPAWVQPDAFDWLEYWLKGS